MEMKGQRRFFLFVLLVGFAYVVSRLLYLGSLPVFVDEGIHIGWAQHTPLSGWVDGKWLYIIIAYPFELLPLDPLIAIRLLAVLSGLLTLAAYIRIGTLL